MIRVQAEIFDPGSELNRFTDNHTDMGAIVSFTGHVRGSVSDKSLSGQTVMDIDKVTGMYLEHYPDYTEREIEHIDAQALRRWPGLRTLIIHRYGQLKPGDPIVFVATASRHRVEAFDAAMFLMDYLKTDAPFWKKEYRTDSEYWIEPSKQDRDAHKRW